MQPTKFDGLWEAYCKDVEVHQQNWQTLSAFLPEFINNLIRDLGWSPDLVELGASGESFKTYQDAMYSISDVLVPASKGYWQFWMKLTLAKTNSSPPFHPQSVSLVVPFSVSQNDQVFQVTIETTCKGKSNPFEISGNSKDCVSVSNFIYNAMHSRIQDGISWDLQTSNSSRQIRL